MGLSKRLKIPSISENTEKKRETLYIFGRILNSLPIMEDGVKFFKTAIVGFSNPTS
jgi:hypothetical protein